MGCSSSKLDDEEAVQLCRDRRNFIKQAVEQRYRFALGHIAYLQSLRRVSAALLSFVEGNERHELFADRCATTPPLVPEKRLSPEIVGIPLESTAHAINCLMSGGNPSIPVEEWPPRSPETMRVVESLCPAYEAPFASSPCDNRLSPPPASPQWDFFWNPFVSLDQYRYQCSHADDDEMAPMLRKVWKEEEVWKKKDDEEEEEEEGDDEDDDEGEKEAEANSVPVSDEKKSVRADRDGEKMHEVKECQTSGAESMQVSSEARDGSAVEASGGASGETPNFTVYVNQRPMSMVQVVKDVDSQFVRIIDSAQEVSGMLEATRALYSASNELTGAYVVRELIIKSYSQ